MVEAGMVDAGEAEAHMFVQNLLRGAEALYVRPGLLALVSLLRSRSLSSRLARASSHLCRACLL